MHRHTHTLKMICKHWYLPEDCVWTDILSNKLFRLSFELLVWFPVDDKGRLGTDDNDWETGWT